MQGDGCAPRSQPIRITQVSSIGDALAGIGEAAEYFEQVLDLGQNLQEVVSRRQGEHARLPKEAQDRIRQIRSKDMTQEAVFRSLSDYAGEIYAQSDKVFERAMTMCIEGSFGEERGAVLAKECPLRLDDLRRRTLPEHQVTASVEALIEKVEKFDEVVADLLRLGGEASVKRYIG